MLGVVIYSVILMLLAILTYEIVKVLWGQLTNYKIKRECDKYEDKQFEREMQKSFKKLGIEYQKQSKCYPSKTVEGETVRVLLPYRGGIDKKSQQRAIKL